MRRPTRAQVVHGALLAFAGALLARSAQVQLWQGDRWAARAQRQHFADAPVPAARGEILDVRGVPLAQSRSLVRLSVAPREISDRLIAARQLARLHLDREAIDRTLDLRRAWVVLPGTYVPSDVGALASLRGVYSEPVIQRVYTEREATRRIIGRVDGDGHPLDGLELTLDPLLRGESGRAMLLRDARGAHPVSPDDTARVPTAGDGVVLTINQELQEIVEQALDSAITGMGAEGGDIVVLDPHDGEIRAMASKRADPRSSGSPAVSEPFEPGSTLKPVIAARLLSLGRARPGEMMNTENGHYIVDGRTISDEHPSPQLSLADVIKFSSNIGIAKFALRLSPREEFETLRDVGFGTPTGIPYPGEAAGMLRVPKDWSKMSPASLAMGYEVGVTPLQLAVAYATFANGGELMEPALVKAVRRPDGTTRYEHVRRVVRRVMPDSVAATMRAMLVEVVEGGTAKGAGLTKYSYAGKSGTSRRVVRGRGYAGGGHFASFVGLFPADHPQYVIVVKLDNPRGADYFGGHTAAPISRAVIRSAIAASDAAIDRRALAASESFARGAAETVTVAAPSRSPTAVTADAGETAADSDAAPVTFALPHRRTTPAPGAPRAGPDVRGLPLREAVRRLHHAGLRVQLSGFGAPAATLPEAGALVAQGTVVRLTSGGGN